MNISNLFKFLSIFIIQLIPIVILARSSASLPGSIAHHQPQNQAQSNHQPQSPMIPTLNLPSQTGGTANSIVPSAISQPATYLNVNNPLVQQPPDSAPVQSVPSDLPIGYSLPTQSTRRPSTTIRPLTQTTSMPNTVSTSATSTTTATGITTTTITIGTTEPPLITTTNPSIASEGSFRENIVSSTPPPPPQAFFPKSPTPSSAYMTFDVAQPVGAILGGVPSHSGELRHGAMHQNFASKPEIEFDSMSRAGKFDHRPTNDHESRTSEHNINVDPTTINSEPHTHIDVSSSAGNNSSQPLYDLNMAASEPVTESVAQPESSESADISGLGSTTPLPTTSLPSSSFVTTASTTSTTTTTVAPIQPKPTSSPPGRSPEARARLANDTSSGRTSSGQLTGARQRMIPKSMNKCSQDSDCLNGAVCHGGICFCAPGFTGELCATNIDECLLTKEPCLNGGICLDGINGFECDCQAGFKGDRCQEQVDMCIDSPCLNGATCVNHRTNFTCECELGWEGRHCELNIDECASNPCQNNATCRDLINDYRCECGSSGFSGKNCEIDIDDCAQHPCGFGARECVDLVADYKCVCYEGFVGKKCDIDLDECQPNPCENNGTCVERSQHPHLFLHSANANNNSDQIGPHFGDQLSDSTGRISNLLAYLAASGSLTANGSQSTANLSQLAGFQCECREEFYGDRCEERKKCYTKPLVELCNNPQAECVNSGPSYECLINASFDGSGQNYATYRLAGSGAALDFKLREIYVRYRSFTGGVLMSFETVGGPAESPIADIQLNKSGLYLSGAPIKRDEHINFYELLDGQEREIKLGLDTPTEIRSITLARQLVPLAGSGPNSSTVSPVVGQPAFKGCLIQVRLNNQLVPLLDYPATTSVGGRVRPSVLELAENRLEVGGPCRTCFEGDCKNQGHCVGGVGGNSAIDHSHAHSLGHNLNHLALGHQSASDPDRCQCPAGFTGAYCELDVNECEKYPGLCHNGGVCENLHGGFRCQCRDGYRGDKCHEIADYCKAKQPCQNGATCKNIGQPSTSVSTSSSSTSPTSLPTSSSSSSSGSTSSNGLASFQCECPSSHIGKRCERRRDCVNECHSHHAQCLNNSTCACLPGRRDERLMCEFVASCDSLEAGPDLLCHNGGTCVNSDHGGYSCACQEPYYGPVCQYLVEKPAFDLVLLIVVACVGSLMAACAVVLLVVFRSVRKARATRGTYSPSTQEKFGNAASELLKLPNPERLI